jgi:DMSO/TMAO reductase YedYZ molybdopterin-dependent catalytic subunit
VFFGTDQGEEVVHPGTPIEVKFTGHFARSMSIADAMNPANILCYEMNGEALPVAHGAPLRLIAPGWFGVANVKWLRRIEVRDTRFLGRFLGRDYVTVREEQREGEMLVVETSIGRGLLKSAPARVVRSDGGYRIDGMAWGPTAIAAVEVRIENVDEGHACGRGHLAIHVAVLASRLAGNAGRAQHHLPRHRVGGTDPQCRDGPAPGLGTGRGGWSELRNHRNGHSRKTVRPPRMMPSPSPSPQPQRGGVAGQVRADHAVRFPGSPRAGSAHS